MKATIKKAVVTRPYHFLLHFTDGTTDPLTVNAESFHAAVLCLPAFSVVGPYKYELLDDPEA